MAKSVAVRRRPLRLTGKYSPKNFSLGYKRVKMKITAAVKPKWQSCRN
jgi:hypothetical protein